MESRIAFLILLPAGLLAGAIFRFAILPGWRRAVERCETADARDLRTKAEEEEAERELRGDANR